jgi:biopolymer transport protein TolR
MAIILGKHTGGQRYRPMSEINVTPMVDVMLVLLVIFMVTAPLLTVGVPVDLPKSAAPNLKGSDEPLVVSLNNKGQVYLMEAEIRLVELAPRLSAIAKGAADRRIFIRADKSVNYGQVMEVMGLIAAGGFTKVSLVGLSPAEAAAPPPPNRREAAPAGKK